MSDQWWWIIETATGLVIFAILVGMWIHLHPRPERRVWKCVRFHGGGMLITPREMSMEEVGDWLGRLNSEVSHVDHVYGFVFYRPRGG